MLVQIQNREIHDNFVIIDENLLLLFQIKEIEQSGEIFLVKNNDSDNFLSLLLMY